VVLVIVLVICEFYINKSDNVKHYIAFDFDGTLVEFHREFMFSETHRIIKKLGHPPVPEDVLTECFSDFDFFRFMRSADRGSDQEIKLKEAFWEEYNWEAFPVPKLFPETLETLERLQEMEYELCIATARATPREEFSEVLVQCGLSKFFKLIETRASPTDDWQDKGPQLKRLIARSGATPEQFTMVGDIPCDIDSAREVGLRRSIGVQSGGIKKHILEASEPDIVLLHLGDLPNFLLSE